MINNLINFNSKLLAIIILRCEFHIKDNDVFNLFTKNKQGYEIAITEDMEQDKDLSFRKMINWSLNLDTIEPLNCKSPLPEWYMNNLYIKIINRKVCPVKNYDFKYNLQEILNTIKERNSNTLTNGHSFLNGFNGLFKPQGE